MLAGAAAAKATPPATLDEILAATPGVFVGTVIGAESHDCRIAHPQDSYCHWRRLRLDIRVARVMRDNGGLRTGAIVKLDVLAANDLPKTYDDGTTIALNETSGGSIGLPATGKAFQSDEARRALSGRSFVFAAWPRGTREVRWALVYPMSMKKEVGDVLHGRYYQTLILEQP